MLVNDIDALADRIAETAAQLDVATHRLLTDIRLFDERGGWGRQGAISCSQWLSWRCGIGLGPAREKLRVAQALGRLPLIDAAFAQAEISYSKIRAITRVATRDTEAQLLQLARHSTAAQMEKMCRLYRQTQQQPRRPSGPPALPFTLRLSCVGVAKMCVFELLGDECRQAFRGIDSRKRPKAEDPAV